MVETETESSLKQVESSFRFHEFQKTIFGVEIAFEAMKMEGSYFIWIGSAGNKTLGDLSTAILTRFNPNPLASNLFGSEADLLSTSLASKISKKLNTPVLLSYNLSDQKMLIEVEKLLWEEIRNNPEFFN